MRPTCTWTKRPQELYEADKLEEQFKAQTVHFLSSPNNFSVDLNRKKILLSPLFDWYGKDFIKTYKPKTGFVGIDDKLRAVLNFVSKYAKPTDVPLMMSGKLRISFTDYNWALNEQNGG
jgi:hypothetical protein